MKPKEIESLNHISDEELNRDIVDTLSEIAQYKEEISVLQKNPQVNRVAIYFREGRIIQREDLLKKLYEISDYRKAKIEISSP